MLCIDSHNHLLEEENYTQTLIDTMDKLGISKCCISGLGIKAASAKEGKEKGLGSLSPDNEDVAKALAVFPDRFIAYASIVLGKDTPETVEYWYSRGFRGVKFIRPLVPYNADICMPVYEKAAQLNMPALFHTGFVLRTRADADDDVDNARMQPVLLDRAARKFQNWPIVMAHFGMPWFSEAAEMARFHPNVYVDITCGTLGWRERQSPDFFKSHLYWPDAFSKIVFGTDVHANFMEDAKMNQERIFKLCNIPQYTYNQIMGKTVESWF